MTTKISNTADLANARRDAAAIREQLRATEALGDEFLFNSFELGKRMLTARRNPAIVPHAGQVALIRLAAAQKAAIEASNNLFRVHDELSKLSVVTGVGDEHGSTPTSPMAALDASGELANEEIAALA